MKQSGLTDYVDSVLSMLSFYQVPRKAEKNILISEKLGTQLKFTLYGYGFKYLFPPLCLYFAVLKFENKEINNKYTYTTLI